MVLDKAELLKRYNDLHDDVKKFPGFGVNCLAKAIGELVEETQAKTLLDYGCGKGFQYTFARAHDEWGGIMPTLYDPGFFLYRTRPLITFDGVICTEVLEHILEEDIDATLDEIIGFANSFIALSISTCPAKKTFDDGVNLHVTQKPKDWWLDKIRLAIDRNNREDLIYIARFESEESL